MDSFSQILSMTICGTSVCFSIAGLRSRLGKTCHCYSAFICELILIKLHNYDNISDMFVFQLCIVEARSQLHMARVFITFSDCRVY